MYRTFHLWFRPSRVFSLTMPPTLGPLEPARSSSRRRRAGARCTAKRKDYVCALGRPIHILGFSRKDPASKLRRPHRATPQPVSVACSPREGIRGGAKSQGACPEFGRRAPFRHPQIPPPSSGRPLSPLCLARGHLPSHGLLIPEKHHPGRLYRAVERKRRGKRAMHGGSKHIRNNLNRSHRCARDQTVRVRHRGQQPPPRPSIEHMYDNGTRENGVLRHRAFFEHTATQRFVANEHT